jgi:23S rRNA (cytosine1962-C5)-methyltransferase
MNPPAPPCAVFEDDHLLLVNKPAGWNTHAPGPHAGEGLYEWLRHREPRWASLAIIHRLDKETSGLLVFGKTPAANKSLTAQFTDRAVHKQYLLLTDRPVTPGLLSAQTNITRAGDRYVNAAIGEPAETNFQLAVPAAGQPHASLVAALPLTGRTHQIRVHAAGLGFPILGDSLYGGTPFPRVCLHAHELKFLHPVTGEALTFTSPVDFSADPAAALRAAFIDPGQTDAFRIIHGASDRQPGWYVDRLGDYLLSQSEQPLGPEQKRWLERLPAAGVYHKMLNRRVQRTTPAETSPQPGLGRPAPDKFIIRETGVRFELSFSEGYSVGLFLDQRDNRRRFLTGHIAADFPFPAPRASHPAPEVLNCFAYTCGFSVCAALAGAKTTSLDLSKKYLDWGRRHFALNGLDPAAHDFIYGDTFDWLRRFAKKGRAFDAVILDPPTFSRSDEGVFRAEKDFGKLVTAALPVLKPGGVLLASTNAATLEPEDFLETVTAAIRAAGRKITRQHYVPQPPDFPVTREEPAYLKTVWLRIA